jgi:hypothetical protein
MTAEKAFFYYCAIYGTPADAVERYGSYFDATNYQRAMADEFERGRYRERMRTRIATEVGKVNFNDKFSLVGSTAHEGYTSLGEYSFERHSFPILNIPSAGYCIDAGRTFFGNCLGHVLHVDIFRLSDAANGAYFNWSLPMSESDANAFVKGRAASGGVNRRVAAKITYSVMNRKGRLDDSSHGQAAAFIPFIYLVEIYSDEGLTRRLGVVPRVNPQAPSSPRELEVAEKRENEARNARDSETARILLGTWRDENSVTTYSADGTRFTQFDAGKTRRDRWSVRNGTVVLVAIEENGKRVSESTRKEEIVAIAASTMTTRDSGGVWNATRTETARVPPLRPPSSPERNDALISAANKCDEGRATALLEQGVDLNTEDYNGRTALMIASRDGCIAMVRLLVDNYADVNYRNHWSMTALDWAKRENKSDVVEFLTEKGAK